MRLHPPEERSLESRLFHRAHSPADPSSRFPIGCLSRCPARARDPLPGKWIQEFLASPRCHVPAIDEETAHRYGAIHDYLRRMGTPVSPNDLWIAASAAQHGLRVVTLDGDFDRIPQVLVTKLEPLAGP